MGDSRQKERETRKAREAREISDLLDNVEAGTSGQHGGQLDPVIVAAVAVPASWFVSQFAGAIAKGIGDDAYRVLKSSITRWRTRPRKLTRADPEGDATATALPPPVEQPDNTALIELRGNLPRAAFDALRRVDWSTQPPGSYRFNRKTGRWTLKR